MEEKYVNDEKVGTSYGFWQDLENGYILPSEILNDSWRVQELEDAINLLNDWKNELESDEKLNDL